MRHQSTAIRRASTACRLAHSVLASVALAPVVSAQAGDNMKYIAAVMAVYFGVILAAIVWNRFKGE